MYAYIAASVSPALNATFPSSFNAVTFWVAGFGSGSALPEDDSFLSPIVVSQLLELKIHRNAIFIIMVSKLRSEILIMLCVLKCLLVLSLRELF